MDWTQIALAVAVPVVGWLIKRLDKLLSAKADELAARTQLSFIAQLDDIAMGVVSNIFQAEVKHLKAAAADGQITKKEAKKFKKIAMDEVKKAISMKSLAKVMGNELNTHVSGAIEKAVLATKAIHSATKDPS